MPGFTPTTVRVLESHDVDCDGIGVAWHRIRVPIGTVSSRDAVTHAVQTEQMSGYASDTAFLIDADQARTFVASLEGWDADYWRDNGYHSEFYPR
jgi:hypothetical protein